MGGYLSKTSLVSDPSIYATPFNVELEEVQTAKRAQDVWKTYDYVIIGAGAAGCVLANRLSSKPEISVLLIEAGSSDAGLTHSKMPKTFSKLFKSKSDWKYYTTPQPGLNNRKCYWPRGKVLGGCTSMNGMIYHHGSPSDFDEWEKLGATGWSYENITPYFRKAEKFTPHSRYPSVRIEDRGDSGPWQTSFCYTNPVTDNYILAAEEIGIPHNPDLNTKHGTLGATKFSTFITSSGLRSSTATAYLSPPTLSRKNLTVAIESQTTRIIFSKDDALPHAIGVELIQSGNSNRYYVAAKREIILSAGAIGSPVALMLSGIGPREELERFNIPAVKELSAVGMNLNDHLASGPITLRARKNHSFEWIRNLYRFFTTFLSHLQWYCFGTGPCTSNVVEAGCFVRTTNNKLPYNSLACQADWEEVLDVTSAPNAPDMEILLVCSSYLNGGLKPGPAGTDCITLYPLILRPLSRGRISLASTSPFDQPLINPNYLAHPNDLKILIRGVRLSLRIARARALESVLQFKVNKNKDDIFWLGDADPEYITDEEITEFIKANAETLYHPVGTCKMGQYEKDSVVGPDLKIHGVIGLRVADASIFPEQISGHPTATIVAIGEKLSDMILNPV